jgi:3-methyladenine DNA glycosylase/8-oxoguanine DNA glycosylase
MVILAHSFIFVLDPVPPYDFELTVRKPAGWSLFTPFEVFENGTMWTATHLYGTLAGVKLASAGTIMSPRIIVELFLQEEPGQEQLDIMKKALVHDLAADEDLRGFYEFANVDGLLSLALKDRYGMHDTSANTVFPLAALAISLQMTSFKRSDEMMHCFITSYGEIAEFEGKRIGTWPLPGRIAKLEAAELAKTCKFGYRAKLIVDLARKIDREGFPTMEELKGSTPEEAKALLLELPGIGDYSADIINPHGGFPIDVWSVDVFGKLFFGEVPANKREGVKMVKKEGLARWGKWSWLAFFYIVQDLENLSRALGTELRLV